MRLRKVISVAVAQRGNYYKSLFAFTIRFEADDTGAVKDAKHFQDLVRLLNFPPAKEIIISKTDETPKLDYKTQFGRPIQTIEDQDERSLVVGHFAGHGGLGARDQLMIF